MLMANPLSYTKGLPLWVVQTRTDAGQPSRGVLFPIGAVLER